MEEGINVGGLLKENLLDIVDHEWGKFKEFTEH